MKASIVALATLAATGCGTSWLVSQAAGQQRGWDEQVSEARVPRGGYTERLVLSLPLAIAYEEIPTATAGTTTRGAARPFAIACDGYQDGHDLLSHSAFRYGSRWKKGTAISFLIEGAFAALFLATADPVKHPGYYVGGGFLALDDAVALGTFFIPRKEIYAEDDVAVSTHLRDDCPDGLALAIGADVFPIDAAGRIGELGEAALAQWMEAPTGALRATLAGQVGDLVVGVDEQCAWLREHAAGPTRPACLGTSRPLAVTASLPVPAGTLTR
ncbi:MAG: hypothetical protein NT062_00970 [Proteobacteria bacterium]|nr:hypothetical protein [Pseudomonadota bacterium]